MTFNNYKISVIIPTYNRENTILAAIESVLKQTYPVFEILICDDGSVDNTKKKILSLNNDKIKWIEGIHSGKPAVPRNRGILNSTGDYIAFLDSDDTWEINKIENQIFLLSSKKCQASFTNGMKFYNNSLTKFHNKHINKELNTFNLLKDNYIICSSTLIERKIIHEIGIFNESDSLKAIEDYSYWLKVSYFTNWIYLDQNLINYNDDIENSIRKIDQRSYFQQKKIILVEFSNWIMTQKNKKYLLLLYIYYSIFKLNFFNKLRLIYK
jgi:teichuronic acid biosynthesis glycosyltransferase TuaG